MAELAQHADGRRRSRLRDHAAGGAHRLPDLRRRRKAPHRPQGHLRRQEGGWLGLQRVAAGRRRSSHRHPGGRRRDDGRARQKDGQGDLEVPDEGLPRRRPLLDRDLEGGQPEGLRADHRQRRRRCRRRHRQAPVELSDRPDDCRHPHPDHPRRPRLLLGWLPARRRAAQAGGDGRRGEDGGDLWPQAGACQQAWRRRPYRRPHLRRFRRPGDPVLCRADDRQDRLEGTCHRQGLDRRGRR